MRNVSARPETTATVLDASALLALLQNETGTDVVKAALPEAAVSTANASEVMAKLIHAGMEAEEAIEIVRSFDLREIPVDGTIASLAAHLTTTTREHGLGLGDRLCLATAIALDRPALTADRAWTNVSSKGLTIRLIR